MSQSKKTVPLHPIQESLLALAGGLLVLMMASLLAQLFFKGVGIAGEEANPFTMGVTGVIQGALLIGWALVLIPRSQRAVTLPWRAPESWWPVLLIFPVAYLGGRAVQLAQDWFGLSSENLEQVSHVASTTTEGRFLFFVSVVFCAPVAEEILFRGPVQNGLVRGVGPRVGVLLTAVFFALYHMDPLHMIGVFFIGLFLSWLRAYGGSLWPCILAHVLNNLLWVVSVQWPQLQEMEGTLWADVLALGVCALGVGFATPWKPKKDQS